MILFNYNENDLLKIDGNFAIVVYFDEIFILELLKIMNSRNNCYLIVDNSIKNNDINLIAHPNVLFYDFKNIDFLYILKQKYKIEIIINIFNLYNDKNIINYEEIIINYKQYNQLNLIIKDTDFKLIEYDFSSIQNLPNIKIDKLSAIITIYNESECIPIMYDRLTKVLIKLNVNYEIIFVNGASTDNSLLVLENIIKNDHHVIAIDTSRSFGSQASYLCGMKQATGDAVILLDGDLQDPPELIEELYKNWKNGFEVVYGQRVKRAGNPLMIFCYKLFYKIFQKMSYINIPRDAGDFSLIDRKVVNEIINLGETDFMIRGLRAWVGFKQTGINYYRPERLFGKSHTNYINNFRFAKKIIFSFSYLPLEILTYLGLSLTFISFIALIIQLFFYFRNPSLYQIGLNSVICLILIFGGLVMLAIAILGEYQAKILEETKKRPKFIINKIYKNETIQKHS